MIRTALTPTYRIAAGAAIACAPLGVFHPGFAVAALALGGVAAIAFKKLNPGAALLSTKGTAHNVIYQLPPMPLYNPATGLPMSGGVDNAGNVLGHNRMFERHE